MVLKDSIQPIFHYVGAIDEIPSIGNLGDIYLVNGNEYIWTGKYWELFGLLFSDTSEVECSITKTKHPTTCKCCGAILKSNICEYCGAEYFEEG